MITWRTAGARIRFGTLGANAATAVDIVTLENAAVRVTFAISRGCEIVEFLDKRRDVDYCSYSEKGPIPSSPPGPLAPDAVASFHDSYTGGWQLVFPNGGHPSVYRGAPLAQHAEAGALPWRAEVVLDTAEEVVVVFSVALVRLPFALRREVRLRAGDDGIELLETATNLAALPLDAMWGQHVVFGPPFLREGCRILLPEGVTVSSVPGSDASPGHAIGAENWPNVTSPTGGTVDLSLVPAPGSPSEMRYLTGFIEGWYEIRSPGGENGLRVGWDVAVLPYLWLWRELGASKDYPFWGETRSLGLEPFSSVPTEGLASAVANGTALRFEGGEEKAFHWSIRCADIPATGNAAAEKEMGALA